MPTVAEFAAYLERFAPCATAADWDNVGLLLGDPKGEVGRVLTCLTLTPDVAAEAVREGVHLIVSHHPVLFRGAKKLTANTPDGEALLPLLRANIAVYSPHTAFDNCSGGINDGLCQKLGVTNAVPLRPREAKRQCKLVVFVPDADLAKVSDALFGAGAGVIGQYRECSFRLSGTGTFFGTDATNPAVGQKGRREEVPEWRLEVVVPEPLVSGAIAAMRKAHSYEEPAFDVYPLKPTASGGEGRIGELENPTTLGELARRAKEMLRANAVQVVGDMERPVRTVALACGAAGEFLSDAIRRKADVFLTGEVRFHDAVAAGGANVGLILPGHYATERPAVEDLAAKLGGDFPGVTVWPSRAERDPLAAL
ncbi:Putative GTP cyclohydrolase 1 type 2 [Gemmata obscuriglobus]|uniref:GTP cyclohydrolase 1 type 2 homolog n=1 Tax=Gemmata obscuriglobus TaxID=114 RepID=A0A2Z3GWK5_9BACT|nr:Nif3-like dinuclear metal center hexameric protein [Gemmata obscuriglobus]AWM35947.1 Nif3-like dinuclear metal center hexameric protein [Gemmata obscuriglobus]QEG31491.1 Putative GTP cyclohydrolase 1 type 2 [Gemmata obscuriglobus]VTS10833.1 dinuclear metal center sa1388 family : Putative GTP cyclohydrolase 1 type 2 OS=Singulisphaera acidiphila (strain ATCC BAA-1392 / DSM 18658 / VKM B-2454 / MOB10) GN=Sinac_6321 PE=3 SV=1: NIF3 [Gemmata obscuriglobus UQM 2246]